jgi:hypothetical protein
LEDEEKTKEVCMKGWKSAVIVLMIVGLTACSTVTRKNNEDDAVKKEQTPKPARWETPGSLSRGR